MQSIRIKKTTLLALVVSVALVSSAYAWGPEGKCPGKGNVEGQQVQCPGKCFKNDRTALTDEQKEQLDALRQKLIDETAETRIALIAAKKNLNIILETSDPGKKEIKALIKEITELKATLMEKQINHQLEARKIAPELAQRKRFRLSGLDNDGFGGMRKNNCGPVFSGFRFE